MRLMATPNRVFGEQVLVVAGISDKWPARSKEVPVIMFNGEGMFPYFLVQSAFPTFGGAMGVRLLGDGEVFWYEQIQDNFMYPPAGSFASPPTAIEDAHLPKPRPLRGVTSARKEILYLSSEESVGSSNEEQSSWSKIFAGVLRDLGIDDEEKKNKKVAMKKVASKKKVNVEASVTSKKARGGHATVDIPQKGEMPKSRAAAASRSLGSARSRAPKSGATPSSICEEEEEKEVEEAAANTPPPRRRRLLPLSQ
ncbi:hypothetical protein Hanom_Chr08g00713271 [Helianthus anomalus]